MTTSNLNILQSDELTRIQIRPACFSDIGRIFELARSLICKDVASPRILEQIFNRNRSTLLVVDEQMGADNDALSPDENPVSGFIATLPLTKEGERALRAGEFSGRNVLPEWVSPEGETPAAVYIWGLAGATAKAKASIWKSAVHIERGAYPTLPYYASAGSEIGEKLLTRLGYQRLRETFANAPDNLFGRTSHIDLSAAA